MCATDLDLELETVEDELAAGPQPIGGRYAGVAWGLVKRAGNRAAADPAAADPAATDPAAGDAAEAALSR